MAIHLSTSRILSISWQRNERINQMTTTTTSNNNQDKILSTQDIHELRRRSTLRMWTTRTRAMCSGRSFLVYFGDISNKCTRVCLKRGISFCYCGEMEVFLTIMGTTSKHTFVCVLLDAASRHCTATPPIRNFGHPQYLKVPIVCFNQ